MEKTRHFLNLADYSAEAVLNLLKRSSEMKRGIPGKGPSRPLEGRCIGMIFEKPSTRTRVSFDVGVHQLGGHAIFLNWADIQVGRGEPIRDTARVLSRYLDGIIIRTFGHEILDEFARWSTVPIINGLSDLLHPCQVLGDLLTLQDAGLDIRNMKAAWVGDGNNVANSWITAAELLGFELTSSVSGRVRSSGKFPLTACSRHARPRRSSARRRCGLHGCLGFYGAGRPNSGETAGIQELSGESQLVEKCCPESLRASLLARAPRRRNYRRSDGIRALADLGTGGK